MSMWGKYEKSIAAWIHHIIAKIIQAPGRPPPSSYYTTQPPLKIPLAQLKSLVLPKIAHIWILSYQTYFKKLACGIWVLYIKTN